MTIEEFVRKYGFGGLDLVINSLLNDTQNDDIRYLVKTMSAELAEALKPIAYRIKRD